jgi:hypothetical protein
MTRDADPAAERRIFRRTVVKVFVVQIATLALLWLLQTLYHP